jgi:hypothetical protein
LHPSADCKYPYKKKKKKMKELKSEQAVLHFWEKCNKFLLKAKESNHHTQGWSQRYLELKAW